MSGSLAELAEVSRSQGEFAEVSRSQGDFASMVQGLGEDLDVACWEALSRDAAI